MSFQAAKINDALKRIEGKLDQLLSEKESVGKMNVKVNEEGNFEKMTENQIKMAKVRAARKVNTGQAGRG